MGPQAKSELSGADPGSVRAGEDPAEKGRLLAEAISVTGYHRKALMSVAPAAAVNESVIEALRGNCCDADRSPPTRIRRLTE